MGSSQFTFENEIGGKRAKDGLNYNYYENKNFPETIFRSFHHGAFFSY